MATVDNIRESINAIATRMDRDNDILFLFLTSHGAKDHEFRLNQNAMALRGLRPQELARILGEVIDHARQGQLEAERAMRKR